MNHIYRLCWNRSLCAWVPASELAKSKGAGTSRSRGGAVVRVPLMLSLLSASLGMSGFAWAGNAPTGGQIVSGSGQITQSGNVTTIQQDSQTLSINWQNFGIGASQTVDFLQPGSSSIAVNRVLGNTASDIEGHLNANGQVWLINPNGVLFGKDAQVNVGGIVASTLDLDSGTPGTGNVHFAGNGRGSVVNLGSITVTPGGYAALLGNSVSNQGVIRAQLGTVALAGGTAMTLTFADNHLMRLVVDANTVRSLVENRQLIVADGGNVLMTAGARNSLIDSAVNNTGTVQAQTVAEHNGTITLLGGMDAGTVNVGGRLDASAPNGGDGGFIETSGAQAHIANDAAITTRATSGKTGEWLVDPTDFTIAASGGDITGSQLSSELASSSITLSSADGASGTSGNVNVDDAVSWSAANTLTLTASNNVVINSGGSIANTNAGGKTVLQAGNAFVNNVGASALSGNWAIYSSSPTATGANLGGLAPAFIQYNATTGTTPAASGNGVFYSTRPVLSVTGLSGTVTKSYDGTATAPLAGSNFTDSGLINGDTIGSTSGTYSQSDVGTSLTVTSPSSINGFNIVNGSIPVYGYTLSGTGKTTTGSITAAQLYATIVGDPTKVYDGTTTAPLASSNYYITGLATGQSITVNQPSSVGYASADVNTNGGTTQNGGLVAVGATFASTNFAAGSGTKLSNYVLPAATSITSAALAVDSTAGYGTITPAPVYLSGVQVTSKTYDASTSDALNISNASIYGVVNGDNVTLDTSGAIGNFANPDAGNNLAVALSGFTLTGSNATKVADYALIAPTNLTADIYQKALTVAGVTATDKVYDGTTADALGTGNAVLSGFVNAADQASTTLSTGSAAGTFSQADVGNGLAVAVSGLAVNNSNYTVTQPTGLVANITPASLSIAFSGSADKIYDGTSYATLPTGDFTVTGMVGGQTVSVNQAPAVYTDSNGVQQSNVGSYTAAATLQSSDLNFASGAKAGNYIFNTSVSGAGDITPAPLTVTITGNPTRTYDGASDTSATLGAGNYTLNGLISGQSITLSGPFTGNYYDTTNAAAPGAPSYEGNAGTWGVVSTLDNSTTSGNYVAGSGTSLSNYILPATALGYGTITPAGLTGQLVTGASGSKVYDGTSTIAVTGSSITAPGSVPLGNAVLVLGGVQSGDSGMTLSTNLTGVFASANVGSQPLGVSGIAAADFTCTGCSANWQNNYTFPESVTGTGTILAKQLYISLTGITKQYDGNTTVLPLGNGNFTVYGYVNNDSSGTQDSGWVGGQGATITPTASFAYASPNVVRDTNGNVVGNAIGVTGTLTQNNYTPVNGNTLLSNYQLVYNVSGMGSITPAPLYVDGVYAQDKIYDGGTGALVNIGNGQLAGLADVDKNAGNITLSVGNSASSTADGISSSTGGTIVPNSNGSFTATGSPVGGTFASANAGNGQVVATTFTLGGSSAGNYSLVTPALTANITPRPLAVTGISANAKAYDGTTSATFTFTTPTFSQASGSGASVSGLLAQDAGNVSLNQGSGTGSFATANANTDPGGAYLSPNGQPIAVTASGFTLNGGAAGNYVLAQPTGLSADIAQAQISASLTGNIAKAYDGTSTITIPAADYGTSGWVNGQGGTITQTQSGYYGAPNSPQSNVGTYDVTANLVSSDWTPNAGTSLSNYALPSQVVGNLIGTITPLALNLSATRVYDATANIYASISGNVTNADNSNVFGTLNGINGDQFTVTGTGATSAKDVGTYTGTGASGSPTSGQGFNLGTLALVAVGGANAGNYTLVGGTDSYIVTQAPLNVTGATVASKVYNASTAATVTGATVTQGNAAGDVLGSDVVTVSNGNIAGTFASANANAGLTGTAATPTAVTIDSADITGTDAMDYRIVQPAGLAGTINQAPVTIAGVRQYDGTNAAAATGSTWTISGLVGSQTLKVNAGTGTVSGSNSPNVGTYTDAAATFGVGSLSLGNGTNGGLAGNYAIAATGNQFQITPYTIDFTGSSTYTGSTTVGVGAGNFFNGAHAVASNGAFATGVNGETLDLVGPYTLANGGNAGTNGTGANNLTLAAGTGSAGNYQIGTVTYTVNPYVLSFSGTRTYDGTASVDSGGLVDTTAGSATAGTATFSGLNGDTFTVGGGGSLSSAKAGSYGSSSTASGVGGTPSSTTQIGVTGLTLNATGANAGTEKISNYTLVGGSDTYDISKATVTLTGVRQYDGTTGANGSGNLISSASGACAAGSTCWVVNGIVNTDQTGLSVNGSDALSGADVGTYDNAGTGGRTFTSTGLSLGGSAAGNYTLATSGNQFVVDPYVVDLTGTRVYDGTTAANAGVLGNQTGVTAQDGTIIGVNGETLSLTGSGVLAGKDVNGGTPYTGTGVSGATSGAGFNLDSLGLASGTGNASNYTLAGGSDSLVLTPKTIAVNATAANKVYDGTNTATVTSLTSGGVISGDTVTFADGGATFSDANAANGKTVTVTGIAAGGTDAGDYALGSTKATTTANITPYVLGFNGARQYDGSANVDGSDLGTLTGLGGDQFIVSGQGTASSANANTYTAGSPAGTPAGGQQIGVNGLTLAAAGSNAGTELTSNYTLEGAPTNGQTDSYTITPYVIDLTGTRVYDGTTAANAGVLGNQTGVTAQDGTIIGVNGETLSLTGSGVLAGKDVNGGTPYTGTGVSGATGGAGFNLDSLGLASGTGSASNYTLLGGSDSLVLTPKTIAVNATAANKVYDDTNTATVTSLTSGGVISGDTVTFSNSGGTATFASPNVAYDTNGNVTSQAVAVTGIAILAGGDSGDYQLSGSTANTTASITPLTLNLTGSRTYDATTNIYSDGTSGGSFGTITGLNGDTFTLSGEGSTSGKDVNNRTPYTGTGASGSPSSGQGFNLGTLGLVAAGSAGAGTDLAGNYTLAGGTDSYTITPATLTVVGTTVNSKAYDGTTAATLSGATLSGVLGSDGVALGNDTGGSFATPNAGRNIGVTASTMTIGGVDAGDYTLVQPTGLSGTITPRVLDLTGSRTYDATTNIYSDGTSGGSFGTITGLNGDTFTLSGEGSTSGKDVNNRTSYTGTGASGSPSSGQGFNLGTLGLVAAGSAGAGTDLSGNYTLVGGTDSYTITPATLTVAGTTVNSKAYDGTTAATLSGATLSGVLGSDGVALGNDTGGSFATPNAGRNIGVTAGTMTIGGADAGDYTLVQPTGLSGTIAPRVLNLTGQRVYDGNTDAGADLFGNNGVLTGMNGESLTLGGTGTLSTKNAGTQQPFGGNGLNGFTLTGNGSALASNYTLVGGTDWVTITPLTIAVDASGQDKTYDGTTTAGVTLGSSGVLAGDTVNFNDGAADFNSPDAGGNVGISVSGITASGADAGNYVFNTAASTSATISPYVLNLAGQRVYDATTHAYGGDFGTVAGLDGDTFTVEGTGSLTSKNVGTYTGTGGSSFALGNLALVAGGAHAATELTRNYTLVGGADSYAITPATLTVVGTTVATKTYDGNTMASLSGSTLSGVLGGDSVTLGDASVGTFASANAGTEGVATGMAIGGAGAGNYILAQPTGLRGTIDPYVLDLGGTRVYDGTPNAAAGLFGRNGALSGIDGQTVLLGGTGQVVDKNVGAGKPFISLGSLALSDGANGGLAGNYTLVGGVDTLSITPKTIVVDATGTNKMYSGTTPDAVKLDSAGMVAGDSVQFVYEAASFSDPNIGNNKPVMVTGVQLSGADAGNYLLASPTVYTEADITGARASAFGISSGTLASVNRVPGPTELATPYGLAPQETVGAFTGNKKRLHHPVERNVSRGDFTSGLALKVIDGGVREPVMALP
ncbi:YDG domain-containing protein [Rhodanobacter terrae]|uniref:YDG domain-containing protein n=1 Tax=Rhodanobacter terrae TaxID=418647 RepID=A0ABW0SVQ7_9GAMM